MRSYTGTVAAGNRRMAEKMSPGSVSQRMFDDVTGVTLVPGTFNVRLSGMVDIPKYAGRIERRDLSGDWSDTVYITPARVSGIDCWLIRHLLVEHWDQAGSLKDILEFVSDKHLRKELSLYEGDEVIVEF